MHTFFAMAVDMRCARLGAEPGPTWTVGDRFRVRTLHRKRGRNRTDSKTSGRTPEMGAEWRGEVERSQLRFKYEEMARNSRQDHRILSGYILIQTTLHALSAPTRRPLSAASMDRLKCRRDRILGFGKLENGANGLDVGKLRFAQQAASGSQSLRCRGCLAPPSKPKVINSPAIHGPFRFRNDRTSSAQK
jgi:hypothetical protein